MNIHYYPYTPSSSQDQLVLEDQLLRSFKQSHSLLFLSQTQGFILGFDDLRLPNFPIGYQSIHHEAVLLRSVGGKAVYNDEGVLNISYILTGDSNHHHMYQTIAEQIIKTLAPFKLKIAIGTVAGSYCAGLYDLSVDGKKIGGIAQKRVKDTYLVSAYIAVNGDQFLRSTKVKAFYESMGYDVIDPLTMTTLETCLNRPLSVDELKSLFVASCTVIRDEKPDLSKASKERITRLQENISAFRTSSP